MKKEEAKLLLEAQNIEIKGSKLEFFWDDKKIFEALLVMGVDPNYQPNKDYTILALTVAWNKYSAFSLLLKHGANPNVCCTTNTKVFLIYECAQKKRYVKALIKANVDINKQNYYLETALHHLIECGNLDLAQLFLDNGANVLIKNQKDKTPLDLTYEKQKYYTEQYSSIQKLAQPRNVVDSVIQEYRQEVKNIEQLLTNMLIKAGLKT